MAKNLFVPNYLLSINPNRRLTFFIARYYHLSTLINKSNPFINRFNPFYNCTKPPNRIARMCLFLTLLITALGHPIVLLLNTCLPCFTSSITYNVDTSMIYH